MLGLEMRDWTALLFDTLQQVPSDIQSGFAISAMYLTEEIAWKLN